MHEKEAGKRDSTWREYSSISTLLGHKFFSISEYKHRKEKFFVKYNFVFDIVFDIFFKSKNRRVEKKEGTVEARPIRYSILRLFSFTWERGGEAKCENKCRFYYSLRPVPFYERYTEWRLREREEKNDSKGFGHDFSERFYDSLLVCQLSGDIDCYHGRVESRT